MVLAPLGSSVSLRQIVVKRTQKLVLAFFLPVWIAVITILAVAPQVYIRSFRDQVDLAGVTTLRRADTRQAR